MSHIDQVTIADRVIAEFNRGDWQQISALFSPDMTYSETGTGRTVAGAAPYIELLKGWRHIFPDCTGTILATAAEGATVVHQLTWEGTQAAALPTPSGEVPSRGRRISIPAAMWYTIADGRVVTMHHYLDMLALLQQVGAFEPAPVGDKQSVS